MSDLKPVKEAILKEATDNVIEYMVEEDSHYDNREEWVEDAITADFLTARKLTKFERWLENE